MALNDTEKWDLCPQAADRYFGPSINARCRGGFDFTLTFEQSILSIAPSALLLLIVPFRLYWLSRSSLKTNVSLSVACSSKLLAVVALVGLQVALLVLWVRNPQVQTVATIPAAALSLVDALSICLLSYMEHTRSIRPSTLLGVFLLASLVLDIPQSRTLFLMGNQTPMASVFTAATGLKVILLMSEAQSKIHELRLPYRHHPPEATANVWARTLFWWLNPLFFRGFARLLSIEDLFSMDSKLATFHFRERMQASWARRAHSKSPYALIMATISCMRWEQQLFCLARTMLRSGKIPILDEATSNVDAETDQVMQGIIRDEFQDYTVLTVAHRLDTIMDSDVVAVLDQGRLAEYGPPRDLLAQPSMFADLVGRSSVESTVTIPSG